MSADRDLVDVLADAVSDALDFFAARDEMNAKVHLAVTRWSPITEQCRQALDAWRNFRYPPAATPVRPMPGHFDHVLQLREAIRLTREYVGSPMLPALPGWAWFDAIGATGGYDGFGGCGAVLNPLVWGRTPGAAGGLRYCTRPAGHDGDHRRTGPIGGSADPS